ncbi:electron transfer flavoprotein-ubiquinone oxidoreductase [Formicincola oecophyllae]|uniref:Electron transfer flavoprotein-ubiquinone oxidoreductase n=1 Tax=Formicincola oecophyllae TaxID=2558361 RepID=A0A4Y6UA91_9PROT|nr:electron transfer flavoprotein-ubiquinone oxidoreductase [Formicincola oecophyllae]QDH14322.1 electron transfer flavoprotein-ubiquinone oxidoreductase [Formicincola oecophyllae]
MQFDVVVAGGGPAGLAAAIRLKQLQPGLSVCLIEKAAEIGGQVVSGAVIETRALDELLPAWRELGAPLETKVNEESLLFLTAKRAFPIPALHWAMPDMDNRGNYIVSLGDVCRWLGEQAEALGVDVFPGFGGAHLVIEHNESAHPRVVGVTTGDMGRQADGSPGPQFQPGVTLEAKQVILAEGAHGSLSEEAMSRFFLRKGIDPQTYGLGIKELWEVPAAQHRPGFVQHSFGWPLDSQTYGGAFLYHFGRNLVAYGFVTGLDYRNPYLSPFEEMQRTKKHPAFSKHLKGGKRLAYGARALTEGGLQCLPRLTFPGGVLAGDSAGFLNMPKIKGTHTAMKSGMVAAEAVVEALTQNAPEATSYQPRLEQSWLWGELHRARNIRPAFHKWGLWGGALYAGLDGTLLRGHTPWTLHHHQPDCDRLRHAADARPITYPAPDGLLTFDKLSSLQLANINHDEGQPSHLVMRNPALWREVNLNQYQAPETRYCPAAVYEEDKDATGKAFLRINASNCLQCKSCAIKDPTLNIHWTVPEGGSGPSYPPGM